MANFEQVLFTLQFVIVTLLFLYKLSNILTGWVLYDWKGTVLIFVISVFFYGMNLVIAPLAYENMLLIQLSKLELLPFLVTVALTMIEAFMLIQKQIQGRNRYVSKNGR